VLEVLNVLLVVFLFLRDSLELKEAVALLLLTDEGLVLGLLGEVAELLLQSCELSILLNSPKALLREQGLVPRSPILGLRQVGGELFEQRLLVSYLAQKPLDL